MKLGNETRLSVACRSVGSGDKKVRGKIRTSERTRHESFYLLGEQYTAATVKPILGWARHRSLPLKGKSLIRIRQEIRGMKSTVMLSRVWADMEKIIDRVRAI